MSLPDVLLNAAAALIFLDVPVAIILVRAALRKPHITALTLMAVASWGIAILISAYVFAALNAVAGYPVPKETAQIGFRLAAVVLAIFPPLFLLAYLRGWFRDGQKS